MSERTSTPKNGPRARAKVTTGEVGSASYADADQPIGYLLAHEVARQDAYDRGYRDGQSAVLDGITDRDQTIGGLLVSDDDAQTVLSRRTSGPTDEQWVYLRDALTAEALRLGFVRVTS